jgi:hypothetical protein
VFVTVWRNSNYLSSLSVPDKQRKTMSAGSPFLVHGDQPGEVSGIPMSPASIHSSSDGYQECFLQEIIDKWPTTVPVRDFYPGVEGLLSLGREVPVPLADGKEGAIDNLLLAEDGHLVIVETKLWRNHEAVRAVVAQTLQYAIAVSQLTLEEFENCLRRSYPHTRRLQNEETVLHRAREFPETDDEFEDRFDLFRRRGELLLLIVADGVHQSAERLVSWINEAVGASPVKVGIVEFRIYNVPDNGHRVIVPRTLLRIREASRHVISIDLRSAAKEQVQVTVSGDQEPGRTKVNPAPPAKPLTEGELLERVRRHKEEYTELARAMISAFNKSGLMQRGTPASIQFGVAVAGDYLPLVSMDFHGVWFSIPARAVRDLGEERFVASKQRINRVAQFYPSEYVADPAKTTGLGPNYRALDGKIDSFVAAVVEIAETIRGAVEESA